MEIVLPLLVGVVVFCALQVNHRLDGIRAELRKINARHEPPPQEEPSLNELCRRHRVWLEQAQRSRVR